MSYDEDDYLALSGIQHYCFCKRQWALIHIEQLWRDDSRTASGNIFHEKVDGGSKEKRGSLTIVRGLPVSSSELGLSGRCDVVEFHQNPSGHRVKNRDGLYDTVPVEYKVGHRKSGMWDRVQLCAEAVAIEESLCTVVNTGFLFYGQEKRRETVEIDSELRKLTKSLADEMHHAFDSGTVPNAEERPHCRSCSLFSECAPGWGMSRDIPRYISSMLEDHETTP